MWSISFSVLCRFLVNAAVAADHDTNTKQLLRDVTLCYVLLLNYLLALLTHKLSPCRYTK